MKKRTRFGFYDSKGELLDVELWIHPGAILAFELEGRGWTAERLAQRMPQHSLAFVKALLAEKKPITIAVAKALQKALGIAASFWLRLQLSYDVVSKRRLLRQQNKQGY